MNSILRSVMIPVAEGQQLQIRWSVGAAWCIGELPLIKYVSAGEGQRARGNRHMLGMRRYEMRCYLGASHELSIWHCSLH